MPTVLLPVLQSYERTFIHSISDFIKKFPDYHGLVLCEDVRRHPNDYEVLIEERWNRGVVIYVPSSLSVILDLTDWLSALEGFLVEKMVIIVDAGASLSLTLGSENNKLATFLRSTTCFLSTNAKLNYVLDHLYSNDALVIENSTFYLDRNATLDYWVNYKSAKKVISWLDLMLEGEGSRAVVKGGYRLKDLQEVVLQTRQNHMAAHTSTELVIKGILDDQSKVVYQGTIFVNEQGRGTQASQTNKNILLSDSARAHSMPQLEVLTNDVSCQHGSAVGYLDLEQLHYLQARGLSEEIAKKLLLDAFFADVVYRKSGA